MRSSISPVDSVARSRSRRSSSSTSAEMKMVQAPGTSRCTCSAPSSSSSRTQTRPCPPIRSISDRSVPYRLCETYSTHSRNSPSSTRSLNCSSERNQYSRPSSSPARIGRVVAEIATSSCGSRSSSARISVPLPAPDGPVTTKTGFTLPTGGMSGHRRRSGGSPMVEEIDELGPLALGEAAHRLRLADPALVQQTRRLDAAELGDRHQHVEDLRGRDVLRRVEEDRLDLNAAVLQVLLQLRAPNPDVVRTL